MHPRDAARRWADAWKSGWEALDAERVLDIYHPDAVHWTEPFREPSQGIGAIRAYLERVFGEEEDPRVVIGEPIVDGDRAAIAWWASLREDGADATLAGTSLIRFSLDGAVVEQWDSWNALSTRRDPSGSGPFSHPDT